MISHDLFQWGQLRQTLLGVLLRDLSLQGAQNKVFTTDFKRFISDPIYQNAVNEHFLQRLLEDVKTRYAGYSSEVQMLHANLGFELAQKYKSPLVREFLLILMESAIQANANDSAERAARLGIEKLGGRSSPEFLSRCHDVWGRVLYDRGDFQRAIPIFEAGAQYARDAGDDFGEWDRLTNVVACCYFLGNHLESLDYIDRAEAIAREMRNPTALTKSLIDRGNAELNLHRIDRAESAFIEALEAAKDAKDEQKQSDCLGNLGSVYYLKGEPEKGEQHHRRALEISRRIQNEQSEQLDLNNLAQALWALQKPDEAVQCIVNAIEIAERRMDAGSVRKYREDLRNMYHAMGYYQKARAVDELITPSSEQEDEVPSRKGESIQTSQVETASKSRILEQDFHKRMKAGDVDGACRLVDNYIALHPDDWMGYFHRGLFLNLTGQFQESIQAYERALELNPQFIETHYNLLNSWLSLGDLQTPLSRYETLVQDNPLDPVLRTALGRAYGLLGRHDEAIRNLKEAARLDPQNYMVMLTLSEELFSKAMSLLRTDWDAAWSCFEECSDFFISLIHMDETRQPTSYTTAGECYERMAIESYYANPPLLLTKMGAIELVVLGNAASFYQEAIELAPHLNRPRDGYWRVIEAITQFSEAKGLTEAGTILRDAGKENQALLFFELSMELNPELPETYYQLALLYLERAIHEPSVLSTAEDTIKKAIALDPDNPDYAGVLRRIRRNRGSLIDKSERDHANE